MINPTLKQKSASETIKSKLSIIKTTDGICFSVIHKCNLVLVIEHTQLLWQNKKKLKKPQISRKNE